MSNSVLSQGNNSAVINLSPTEAMVVRVVSSVAPQPISLTSVKASIILAINLQKAEQEAALSVQALVSGVNKGGNLASMAMGYGLTVQSMQAVNSQTKALPASVLSTVLTLGVGQAEVASTQNGMMIVDVTRVYPNPKSTLVIPASAINGLWSQIEETQFLSQLQTTSSIKINPALLSK